MLFLAHKQAPPRPTHLPTRVVALRLALPAFLASGCLALGALTSCDGTGSGDTGDPIHKPIPTELGNGQRVHDVVGEASWLNDADTLSTTCQVPADQQVSLSGQVIVAVDRFDETGGGQTGNIYVEDLPQEGAEPVPFSGLTIFGAGFTPPDLRVFEGDVVDTFGAYSEFQGPTVGFFPNCKTLPEATGTLLFRFENGYRPAATLVKGGTDPARWDAVKGYRSARRWLGMLVRFQDVSLPNPAKSTKGRYTYDIDIGGGVSAGDTIAISNELFDLEKDGPALAPPVKIKSVTGILTYFYGFKIAPRSAGDIEL